ncbi:MAG: ABC transporter ATP-binding protein, partial [Candidatus Hodarchaeales archaeon]
MSNNLDQDKELLVGFLIDKLYQLGNKKLQKRLHKVLKRGLKSRKMKPEVVEFNTFMLANTRSNNGDFDNEESRKSIEKSLYSLYTDYVQKTSKLLRSRTKRNRSEIESHKILADFLLSIPKCPTNPEKVITKENQKMIDYIEKSLLSIIERSWIIFWTFRQKGEDRIIVQDKIYHRKYDITTSSSALHTFDELLILNFANPFLKALNQLLQDTNSRVNNIEAAFIRSDKVKITNPDLCSEAFGILSGDLVGGIDALRTIIRQITRIEEIQSSAKEEIEILNGFGEDIRNIVNNGKNLLTLKSDFNKVIEMLKKLQVSIRHLAKQAMEGNIEINLESFHSAIIELPIQLREIQIWADRFMDIAFLSPESGGGSLTSPKEINEVNQEYDQDIIIKVKELHKTYRPSTSTVYALRGTNLEVRKGEFLAVLGPSGSGKTTLINMMAGLDIPDRGEVYLWEKAISSMSDNELSDLRRTKIGFVFQSYLLDPRLTVYENIALPAKMAGKTEKLHSRVTELLESLGLAEYANQDPTKLSGGQIQRVIIGRSCINDPLIVFADEPTGDLDSETGRQVLSYFRKLCEEKGIAFVVVTHDQEMSSFADRIVRMKDG